jgi:hypothetical protein
MPAINARAVRDPMSIKRRARGFAASSGLMFQKMTKRGMLSSFLFLSLPGNVNLFTGDGVLSVLDSEKNFKVDLCL